METDRKRCLLFLWEVARLQKKLTVNTARPQDTRYLAEVRTSQIVGFEFKRIQGKLILRKSYAMHTQDARVFSGPKNQVTKVLTFKTQMRRQMLVPDLYVFTLKFLAYKKD